MKKFRITPEEALAKLKEKGLTFTNLFSHGSLSVEVYRPEGTDPQQPHTRDEIYVVISGTGTFYYDGDRSEFGPGDFLFVPAGVEHRFEDFSEDFATWVFFYGPEGGESPRVFTSGES